MGGTLRAFLGGVQCSRRDGTRISETNRASMERRNLLPSIQKYLLLTLRCADQQRDSTHELVQGQVQLTLSMPCHSGGTGTTEWGRFSSHRWRVEYECTQAQRSQEGPRLLRRMGGTDIDLRFYKAWSTLYIILFSRASDSCSDCGLV